MTAILPAKPRPGVEVLQIVENTTPTTQVPTLVSCAVGVCRQIVDVVDSTGTSLNSGALVQLPALFISKAATGNPAAFTGLSGKVLSLSVINGPSVAVTFTSDSMTAAKVVAKLLTSFAEEGITEATAFLIDSVHFAIATVAKGKYSNIIVNPDSDPEVLDAFGIGARSYTGSSTYEQYRTTVPKSYFPNPRGNLSQVAIENEYTRVFLSLGGPSLTLKEALRTESFLSSYESNTTASITGNVDITGITFADLASTSFVVKFDGTSYTVSFTTTPADAAAVISKINTTVGATVASLVAVSNFLKLSSASIGGAGTVEVVSGTGTTNPLTTLGLAVGSSQGLSTISSVADSSSTTITSTVVVAGGAFLTSGDSASLTGTRDVTATFADLQDTTLIISDGGLAEVYTFPSSIAAVGDVLTLLNESLGSAAGGFLSFEWAPTNKLTITNTLLGDESEVKLLGGTAMSVFGFTPELVGSVDLTSGPTFPLTGTITITVQGVAHPATITAAANAAAVVSQLNAAWTGYALVDLTSANHLRIQTLVGGPDDSLSVTAGTCANSGAASLYLGIASGTAATNSYYDKGTVLPPVSGDELWVDGKLFATITKVAPGAVATRLKLNKSVAVSKDLGRNAYIVAKKLSQDISTNTGRPTPDLLIDNLSGAVLKNNILRDSRGVPVVNAEAQIALQYKGVRKDVSALAKKPSLLKFNDLTDVQTLISPVNSENPLGLAAYFMTLNAPNTQITALGVDEVSAASPYGTPEAYTRACELLESSEVYALAPLTFDPTVAQIFLSHVTAMAKPESKGERVVLFTMERPTNKQDSLIASGTQGNSYGSLGTQLDTRLSGLTTFLVSAGIDPSGTLAVSDGVFLVLATSSKRYSVQSISGSVITIRTSFNAGENDDDFYATTDLNDSPQPSILVDVDFGVFVRGESLTRTDGLPDKTGMAETMNIRAQSYGYRRFWLFTTDTCSALVNGSEQLLPGFYLSAARAAQISSNSPSQSFTNFPVSGFKTVGGSNDYFKNTDLDLIAGGGNWIEIQEVPNGPITSRMALTSDVSSIESQTDSITKAIDYAAKFIRGGLRNYIGRFNITKGLIDTLNHVIEGMIQFLVDQKIIAGGNLNNLIQSKAQPDTVLVDMTLDPFYSMNYVRVTLRV